MIAVAKKNDEVKFLTPLYGQLQARPVAGFDCETYSTKNHFVLGSVSYGDFRGEMVFTDAATLLDSLTHMRNYGHLIYATNLHFDIFTLFQAVSGPRQIPEGFSIFDNGSKLIFATREYESTQGKRYLKLLDSLNLFPLGVYNLGSILAKVSSTYARQGDQDRARYFAVRKIDSPKCMGRKKFDSLSPEEFRELSFYCATDSEVTRKFMEWANGEILALGAKPGITGAGTAMDLFRRRFLDTAIPQPDFDSLVQARFSYYGGRTEDYVKGNVGEVFEHDVTAMYPDAMERIAFPYPSPENFTRAENPSESILELEGFAKVTMEIPDIHYPPLPYRASDHLLFPRGTVTGIWTNLQLRWALEQGCRPEKIHWAISNERTFNPFQNYVRTLIELRMKYLCPGCEAYDITGKRCWEVGRKCENAHATEEVIKLFLNGLYGKFAQNFLDEAKAKEVGLTVKKGGGTFKPIAEATPEELAQTLESHPEYAAKGLVINAAKPSLKAFMNPILAAYITSAAQVKVNQFQVRAEKCGIPVHYTDTDSLYCPKPLPFAIKGKILGELQVSSKPIEEMIIIGPKAKLLKESGKSKATFKGVPSKSWIVEDPAEMRTRDVKPRQEIFDNIPSTGILESTFTRMAKFREAFHSPRAMSVNEMVQVTKEFDPFANPKRRILGKPSIKKLLTESFETKPWRINPETQEVMP